MVSHCWKSCRKVYLISAGQMTKIGLVGCGRWGRNILRDLLSLGCHVCVSERNPENQKKALELGAHRVLSEMFCADEFCDGFVVAVQTVNHYPVVKQLLPFGKPIFCEKPLTPSSAQARELARTSNGRLFVMHKWRYHAAVEAMRQIIAEGNMGKVLSIELKRKQWKQPHTDADAVWILLPHDLCILLHLLGELPPPIFASALRHRTRSDWLHDIIAVLGTAPRCLVHVSECYATYDRGIHVQFEEGAVCMTDPLADHLIVQKGPVDGVCEEALLPIAINMPLLEELKHFVEHLEGGPAPFTSVNEEVTILSTIEQLRSMAS